MNVLPPWFVRAATRVVSELARLRRRLIPRKLAVLELGTMGWVSHAVAAFCELDLPEALSRGARSAQELGAQGHGDPAMLFRLLTALCAYDIVRYAGEGRFALGRLGEALNGDNSAAALLLYANAWWHIEPHARLAQAIREGGSAFEHVHGMPMFEYYEKNASASHVFDAAMQAMTAIYAPPFAAAYDFSRVQHLVDLGGGTGLLLATVLARNAHLRATVFELPSVASRVRVSDRLGAVAGDLLTDAPPAADAYVLSHVLHDWDDDDCVRILRNLRRTMPSHACLLVHELIAIAPNNTWSQDRISDLEMLAMLPGRERTRDEFESLFARSGMRLRRVIATATAESILEVMPAGSPEAP